MIACLALLAALAAPESPTFRVPTSQSGSGWESVAHVAGLELVTDGPADVILQKKNGGWWLVVIDRQGARHEVAVREPDDREAREEIAWIARNLVEPIVGPERPPVAVQPRPMAAGLDAGRNPRWSAGFVVGAPTGVTVRVQLGLQGPWSLEGRVGGPEPDELWNQVALVASPARSSQDRAADLRLRLGIGATVAISSTSPSTRRGQRPWLAVHAPMGLSWHVGRLELFGDVSWTAFPTRETTLMVPIAGGARVAIGRLSDPDASAAALVD